jgi:hypothetical protein
MNARRRMQLAGTIAVSKLALAVAWGSSGSSSTDPAMYYPNEQYSWMYDSTTIAMRVEGCVWATTDDNEDVGCMQDGSSDGTTYWYQMAMCRRAQVAYSVYATDSSSATCTSGTFKGTVSNNLCDDTLVCLECLFCVLVHQKSSNLLPHLPQFLTLPALPSLLYHHLLSM